MTRNIHVDRKDDQFIDRLCRMAFPNHTKKTATLCPTESLTLHGMYWDGGSKSDYVAIDFDTMQIVDLSGQPGWSNPPQFGGPANPPVILLTGANENIVIVESTVFCGNIMPLRLHANPSRLTPFLPKQNDLTEDERAVLSVTRGLKSFARMDEWKRMGLTEARINAAKESLIAKGLLNKRGAITTAGKNAI